MVHVVHHSPVVYLQQLLPKDTCNGLTGSEVTKVAQQYP